ncbi:MAG: LysM peptidoglycan-binding domain-containing protein [Acidobacteriota bacterium]
MTRRLLCLALGIAALAGCASSRHVAVPAPEAVPLEPVAAPAPPTAESSREALDSLLEAAQEAVAAGDAVEFQACEWEVAKRLLERHTVTPADPGFEEYAALLLDDVARLAEQLEPLPGEFEGPPEPAPVAAERVAEAQARAHQETFDLPVVVNAEVTSLIDFYSGPYRERMIAALDRAETMLPFIREELRRVGLPEDLAFLPMVESAFNPRARSRARAQGLWQFVAGTGKLYGLRADGVVDERNDPFLSTRAAVAHLSDLHAMFGSWELALAAYNSGPGRVQRALRRAKGTTDFWQLRRYLPRETRNYVPALWAVLVIVKNPAEYGLGAIQERPVCLARVPVEGGLDLDVLGERGTIPADRLAELNPALLYRLTPMKGTYQLAVPCGSEIEIAAAIEAIPSDQRVRRVFHVIRKGDTLGSIAGRYGSSVATIQNANGIRNPRALRIGQTLVIPRYPTGARRPSPEAQLAAQRTTRRPVAKAPSPAGESSAGRYVVRRGDTLYDIARRHGVTVSALKRRNGLENNRIHPGDVLVMP